MGVAEVHLQRLVFDEGRGTAWRAPESSLFEATQAQEQAAIEAAQAIGATLGVTLDASGCHGAWNEPQAAIGGYALGDLPGGPGR